MSQEDVRTPILVGCGRITRREADPLSAPAPLDLTAACRQAADDADPGQKLPECLDSLAVLGSFSDTPWQFASPSGCSKHQPKSFADRRDRFTVA